MSIALVLALALHGPAAQPAAAPPAPKCENARTRHAQGRETVSPRRLSEEPAANLLLGVEFRDGGCSKPIVIRENVK